MNLWYAWCGSVLVSEQNLESGKFKLARWSNAQLVSLSVAFLAELVVLLPHPWNFSETTLRISWNTLETFFSISLKHCWNTLLPLKTGGTNWSVLFLTYISATQLGQSARIFFWFSLLIRWLKIWQKKIEFFRTFVIFCKNK